MVVGRNLMRWILASISNVLQHQMQDVGLGSDIMLSLKEMFGK